jgi:ABC-type transport system substrate-binding protein
VDDGWRERPDGSPLVLERTTQTDQRARRLDEFFVRDMRAVALRVVLRPGSFQENAKAPRAGQLMMWALGFAAAVPDDHSYLTRFYGRARSFARFRLPAMDLLYERIAELPDGPERLALMRQAERLAIAYMPYKFTSQEVETHLTQARLVGFRQPAFRTDWYHQIDIDDGAVLASARLPWAWAALRPPRCVNRRANAARPPSAGPAIRCPPSATHRATPPPRPSAGRGRRAGGR